MKRISLLLNLVFLAMLLGSGNLYADKPRVKGYYINKAGDRYEVIIQIRTAVFSKNLWEGFYQTGFDCIDKTGKAVKFDNHEAEEFGFTYMNQTYVYRYVPRRQGLNVLGPLADGSFCKLLIDGPCELYTILISRSTPNGGSRTDEEFVLFKNKSDVYVSNRGFLTIGTNNVTLDKFFSDCPDLENRINNKEFKKGDDRFHRVVNAYNSACKGAVIEVVETKEEEQSEE